MVYTDTIVAKRKAPKRTFSRETLLKILQSKFFPDEIAKRAVDEYERVSAGHNYQDARRNGLLYACVLRVYKNKGMPYDLRSVAAQMELVTATMSQGIRLYCDHCARLGENIVRLDPEPIEYVVLLMRQLAEVPDQWCNSGYRDKLTYTKDGRLDIDHIISCIRSILVYLAQLDVSSLTKHSTPRCVASAVTYFHFIARGCTIDKAAYASCVGAAQVSIDRVVQDIARCLKIYREQVLLRK